MKRLMQYTVLISLFLMLACVSVGIPGCATVDTPGKALYVTIDQATEAAENYVVAFDAATPELQAKWRQELKPKFITLETNLALWKSINDVGGDSTEVRTIVQGLIDDISETLIREAVSK